MDSDLARHFPWKVKVRDHHLPRLVNFLITNDEDAVLGASSFALTSTADPGDGHQILWLSNASEWRLRQAALMTGLAVVPAGE